MNFIVDLVIYPFDVMFSVGESDNKLKRTLKKMLHPDAYQVAYSDDFLIGFNRNSVQGGQTLFIHGHRQTVVRLGRSPSHGTIAHEIFHAVELLLRELKMTLCADNDEAYAYLIGYITEQFYLQFNTGNRNGNMK